MSRCRIASTIVQAAWLAVQRLKPKAIRTQKLRSRFGRLTALKIVLASAASIRMSPTQSAIAVRPGPRWPVRDTTAKARVTPAAATNQRWRRIKLIRPYILWGFILEKRSIGKDGGYFGHVQGSGGRRQAAG